MTSPVLRGLMGLVLVIGLALPVVAQQAPELGETLMLEGEGGVSFAVPAWKKTRHDSSVAMLERVPQADERPDTFYMVVTAVEPGPVDASKVDWQRVRSNIQKAASVGDGALTLTLGAPFVGNADFKGQHLGGTLQVAGQNVRVALIALVGGEKLVTVSVLTLQDRAAAKALATGIASSVKLGK